MPPILTRSSRQSRLKMREAGSTRHLGQRRREQPEFLEGHMRVADHLLDLDRLAVARLFAQHDGRHRCRRPSLPGVVNLCRYCRSRPFCRGSHIRTLGGPPVGGGWGIVDLLQADDVGPCCRRWRAPKAAWCRRHGRWRVSPSRAAGKSASSRISNSDSARPAATGLRKPEKTKRFIRFSTLKVAMRKGHRPQL